MHEENSHATTYDHRSFAAQELNTTLTPEHADLVARVQAAAPEVRRRGPESNRPNRQRKPDAPLKPSRSAIGARMVRAGKTLAEAARATGVSGKSIGETYQRLFHEAAPTIAAHAKSKREQIVEFARAGKSKTAIADELDVARSFVRKALATAGVTAVDGRTFNVSIAGRICGGGHCSACGGAGHRSMGGSCSRSYRASVDVELGMSVDAAARKHGVHVMSVMARLKDDAKRVDLRRK